MQESIDIVGDVHGNFDALERLGRELGYDTERGWRHPGGRKLVFVGDLVDRGEKSLEVASLVKRLVEEERALCLLGNHEYNLARWWRGRAKPKHSNEETIAHVRAHKAAWEPVLEFFETLPIALELPSVRVIHAVWHREAFDEVAAALTSAEPHPSWGGFSEFVALGSPFEGESLRSGLPEQRHQPSDDRLHELLIKGYEAHTDTPFVDNDGKERRTIRVCWWRGERPEIPREKRTVFGHYWNVPPAEGSPHFAPPYPSGHEKLRAWQKEAAARVPPAGRARAGRRALRLCGLQRRPAAEGHRGRLPRRLPRGGLGRARLTELGCKRLVSSGCPLRLGGPTLPFEHHHASPGASHEAHPRRLRHPRGSHA